MNQLNQFNQFRNEFPVHPIKEDRFYSLAAKYIKGSISEKESDEFSKLVSLNDKFQKEFFK